MEQKRQREIKLNIKYAVLQAMFWTAAASGYAFLTQILQHKGFGETQIGVINGVKLFATVIFQVVIGSFCDKYAKKFSLKSIIAVLAAAACGCTFIFYKASLSFFETILLFVGFGATFTCISPLIDSLSVLYVNHGRNVNYVWGRAAGSAAWAAACVGFGIFCDYCGVNNLLLLQLLFTGGILIAVLSMDKIIINEEPADREERAKAEDPGGKTEKKDRVHTAFYLLKYYPKYKWFLIGSAVMFMGYNLGTTFLINVIEELGGSNTHYGIAEFVMAISEVPSAWIMLKTRKKLSVDKLMLCCAVFMTLKNAFATYTGDVNVIIISQSCEMLGFGLFYAGSVFLVDDMLPAGDVVKGVSLINAATVGIGEGIGSLLCGAFRAKLGLHGLMQVSVFVSACSVFCMMIMCILPVTLEQRGAEAP